MLEFTSNCHAVSQIDKVCQQLVKEGAATRIKDTRDTEFETKRYVSNESLKPTLQDKQFDVVVYRHYVIRIKTTPLYQMLPWEADIRFWFDRRRDRAGIKLAKESLSAIINSVTVLKYLQEINVKLGGNGELTPDLLAQSLTQVMAKADPAAKSIFRATK